MEENKILEILKKVSLGTKFYSPTFGEMKFNGIRDCFANEQRIAALTENKIDMAFLTDGKFRKSGEVMLFPSKEMRDWNKFAWKKGDVLINSIGVFCIFKEFSCYPYTTFIAVFVNNADIVINGPVIEVTQEWNKASNEDAEKYIEYINADLEKANRKLNFETLEVEKTEFIEQKPKRPEPTYKKISDPPEYEFEPFEKVLVRDQKTDKWTVGLYGFKNEEDYYNYQCVGGNYVYCIPYKGNEHLLGTTNNPD
jgi:hypothetical protein